MKKLLLILLCVGLIQAVKNVSDCEFDKHKCGDNACCFDCDKQTEFADGVMCCEKNNPTSCRSAWSNDY